MKKNTDPGSAPHFSRRAKRGAAVIISLLIGFMLAVSAAVPGPGEGGQDGGDSKPPSKGGNIEFQPEGGTYTGAVYVRLVPGSLKSIKGDFIDSYVCYTLDGSEPSRLNGIKYPRGMSISISRQGTVTLKARLISKVGKYEGNVYSRYYVIRMDNVQTTPTSTTFTQPVVTQPTASSSTPDLSIPSDANTQGQGVVTDLDLLDQSTRDEISLKTEKVIIDAPGITNVKLEGVVRMQLTISNMGKARVSDIYGFSVEPVYKLSEIKSSLEQKFQNVKFSPPTIESNPVEVKLWLEFTKIARFYEKVIFEKQGSSE